MKIIRVLIKKDDIFLLFLCRTFFILGVAVILISDASGRPGREQETGGSPGAMVMLSKVSSAVDSDMVGSGVEAQSQRKIKPGENLAQILTEQGVDYPTVLKLYSEVKGVYNLEVLHAGHPYGMTVENGFIRGFWYEIDLNQHLKVTRNGNGNFTGRIEKIPFKIKKEVVRGNIEESLFQTIVQIGERPELADMLASLFEYDIDFNRDIQEGDRFDMLVEKKYLNGDFVSYGDLLAAKLVNAKKRIYLIRYTDPEGKIAYYHPDGRAAKKMFLKCPLPFIRLTSGYGFRLHPVLGFSSKHNGVDLAAPTGTRIRSTASGRVSRIGSDAVRGNFLTIRHPNGYSSHYYHLSRIQEGLKAGNSVKQGQFIGTVGRSGRATGYHLHYGLLKNGRFINPLKLQSPSLEPLNQAYLDHFRQYSSALFFMISTNSIFDISNRLERLFSDKGGGDLSVPGTSLPD